MEFIKIKDIEIFTLSNSEKIFEYNIIDWHDYFKEKNPIIVEIGCGNGHFLINEALNNKNFNYIGIDIKKDRILKCNKKQKDNNLKNILWINGEAFLVLSHLFEDSSIHKIYMTFPDPWPKRRAHKKRLFNENFLTLVLKKLENNGEFFFISDFEDYYKWCIRILENNNINYFHYNESKIEKFQRSLFAEKWKKENRIFYHFAFLK
ncbi:MAG TPA: tRNA (guanosine(46)-N7)-methyltransferase TrmB [Spirochaetota bacterium]|nr:tRNA (guanosine(46)-N7)-methyltransferase TrmB [Spirochaetota bacterium]HOL57064.1 tRNA (guanosine(46)-N7)-methyltransferase TrmB [Spirochaetota bacterium]HPP04586.1 tRNA (guanosine(46)-N7)-methyltransferase TrmB [Spirochaetota bacterium]